MRKLLTNRGMTYVELIVVLSIFSIITSIALFDYKSFEQKTNLQILAGQIALKISEAQRNALSGAYPSSGAVSADWKPSYGIYFQLDAPGGEKAFIYYADLDQSGDYSDPDFCPAPGSEVECLNKLTITGNNRISEIRLYSADENIPPTPARNLLLNFTRPDSRATMYSTAQDSGIARAEVVLLNAQNQTNIIKAYPSGRVEVQ